VPVGPGLPVRTLHDLYDGRELGPILGDLFDQDLALRWSQAMPVGIDRSGGAAWSAHANDAIALSGGMLLVAAQTGGAWIVAPDGRARALSDSWTQPDLNCLLVGPDESHILAAGKGLYCTDWRSRRPLSDWVAVPLPPEVGEVYQAIFLASRGAVVIADDLGIHFAPWPAQPDGPWEWQLAAPLPRGRYSGLAEGPEGSVVAGCWGEGPDSGFYGIFVLRFSRGALLLYTRASIGGIDERQMAMVRLASSPADRRRVYASVAGAGEDRGGLLAVLRCDDGGLSWRRCPDKLSTSIPGQGDLTKAAGNQGNGWNNCIAASDVNPDVVALGWRNSGAFLSIDGGASWLLKHDGDDSPHLHSDAHAIRFDPHDPSGQRFVVCTDGGVASSDDLGGSYTSLWNNELCDLQFQSSPARPGGFDGAFDASPVAPGVIAGGLQDNGVLWGQVGAGKRWRSLAGGDGLRCAFLKTGQLLWTSNGRPAPQISSWTPQGMSGGLPVPVAVAKPGLPPNDNGLYDVFGGEGHWYRNTAIAAVRKPGAPDASGRRTYAVGAVYGDVYCLQATEEGADPHWVYAGSIPIDLTKHEVRSLASFNGLDVFVGTSDGRIFSVDPRQHLSLELNVATRTDDKTAISHIVAFDSSDDALAIHGSNLLRLRSLSWKKIEGLPGEALFSIAVAERGAYPGFYVATDSRVYSSHDEGGTWKIASLGLPERCHGGDLGIGPSFGPEPVLYLSTYGRSVWFTALKER
jgi:hypothetical protein